MMKRVLAILIYFLPLFTSPVAAEDSSNGLIGIRSTSPGIIEANPGEVVTTGFVIFNRTGSEEEFREELTLPPAWQKVVSDDAGFKLKADEHEVRIMAFMIPPWADVGRYRIGYRVGSRRDQGMEKAESLMVKVLPVVKLELSVEHKPALVIAGEPYQADLWLANQGNSRTEIRLDVKSNQASRVGIEPDQVTLEPGESYRIRVRVETDGKLSRKTTQIVEIKALAEKPDGDTTSVRKVFSVQNIPQVTGASDYYLRLPGKAVLIATQQDGGTGFQMELSGWGNLDEEGGRRLDFQFRGPDIQNKSIWGKRDEFRISYQLEQFNLHVGDRGYSLSPLTQRFSYGRGVEADLHKERFGLGAFYLKDRWGEPKPELLGAYLAYRANPELEIRGNFLDKSRDSTTTAQAYHLRIYSLQTKVDLHEKMRLGLECGYGQGQRDGTTRGLAFRLDLTGRISDRINYSFEKTHAGPEYFGYYNDADYTSGAATLDIWRQLRAGLFYRDHKSNLNSDSTQGPSSREKSYQAGLRYLFPVGPEVSADYRHLTRKDELLPVDDRYQEKTVRLGLVQTLGQLRINTQAERGVFEDRLAAAGRDDLERYNLYVSFHPTYSQNYNLYARVGHSSFTGTPQRTRSVGFSGSWTVRHNLCFSLDFRSDVSGLNRSENRASLFSRFQYTFPSRHTLVLRTQWLDYDREKHQDLSIFAMYTIPLNIPVGRKTGIGVVKGRVYDAEASVRSPLPKIILTADGATAVTDESGEFVFPWLKPGIQHLRVEKGSIGLDRVTAQKQPLAVEVKGGKTTEIEIGIRTACSISGRVVVEDPESDRHLGIADTTVGDSLFLVGSGADQSIKSQAQGDGGLADIVVEIRDEQETVRQLTDLKGGFSFEDLRPGVWTIKVYQDRLPAHHYLEKDELRVDLKPGEKREIILKVLPRLRPIEIIEEGEIE